MSFRTMRRLAALTVVAVFLCITAHPALSRPSYDRTSYDELGKKVSSSSYSVGDSRFGLKSLGDPDRGVGCTPPNTISSKDADTGTVSDSGNAGTVWGWLIGLLQRIAYGY